MAFRNWIGAFGKANALDVNSDLDRGYEAALLIQSLELEYYGDRPIRPELELSVPKSVQATVLRKFRVAINVCRASLDQLEYQRAQLDPQELRQLQLIESVVNRYSPRRASAAPTMTRAPDPLPRSLLGVFDKVRRQLNPAGEATLVAGFRRRRDSTLISLKVLLLLILVPLLVQQVSRTYIISPAVDRFAPDLPFLSYPKPQLEEQAVEKLRVYKAEIEFDALLRGDSIPSQEELQQQLGKKAAELKEEADAESTHAVKNVLGVSKESCPWTLRPRARRARGERAKREHPTPALPGGADLSTFPPTALQGHQIVEDLLVLPRETCTLVRVVQRAKRTTAAHASQRNPGTQVLNLPVSMILI